MKRFFFKCGRSAGMFFGIYTTGKHDEFKRLKERNDKWIFPSSLLTIIRKP